MLSCVHSHGTLSDASVLTCSPIPRLQPSFFGIFRLDFRAQLKMRNSLDLSQEAAYTTSSVSKFQFQVLPELWCSNPSKGFAIRDTFLANLKLNLTLGIYLQKSLGASTF